MRSILTAAIVLAAPAMAMAAELNIKGVYCDENLYVTAQTVEGEDFACTPLAPQTKWGGVAMLCEYPETPGSGSPNLLLLTLIENAANGTLTYIDDEGVTTLNRCPDE